MKVIFFITLSSLMFLLSCRREEIKVSNHFDDIIILEEINMENRMLNIESSAVEGSSHSGKYFSSVDSTMQYGAGYSYILHDSLKEKNLTIYVSAWVREMELPLTGGIAVSISTSKGSVGWNVIQSKFKNYKAGDWIQIKDSIYYKSEKLKDAFTEIKIFGYKNSGKDKLDLDDLQIKYKFSKK